MNVGFLPTFQCLKKLIIIRDPIKLTIQTGKFASQTKYTDHIGTCQLSVFIIDNSNMQPLHVL